MTELIDKLALMVARSDPSALKRLRLAVSSEEYREIRNFMLERFGVFYERIMGVPLVVEEDPENPPIKEIVL